MPIVRRYALKSPFIGKDSLLKSNDGFIFPAGSFLKLVSQFFYVITCNPGQFFPADL